MAFLDHSKEFPQMALLSQYKAMPPNDNRDKSTPKNATKWRDLFTLKNAPKWRDTSNLKQRAK